MLRPLLALAVGAAVASAGGRARSEFRSGEFVPTARRVQYHGLRSAWTDLTGRHCPRLGDPATLALPLPPPHLPDGAALRGTYKVQLAFDGERLRTPWLTVVGRGGEGGAPPVITVTLTRAGRRLVGVRAAVADAPPDYVAAHPALAAEWRGGQDGGGGGGGGVWPRHVPVVVRWDSRPGADLVAGAYAVLAACLAASVLGAATGLAGMEAAVADLVAGVAAAVDGASAAAAPPSLPDTALPPHAARPITPTYGAGGGVVGAPFARTAPLYGGGGVRPPPAAPPPPPPAVAAYGGALPPPPHAASAYGGPAARPLYGGPPKRE